MSSELRCFCAKTVSQWLDLATSASNVVQHECLYQLDTKRGWKGIGRDRERDGRERVRGGEIVAIHFNTDII